MLIGRATASYLGSAPTKGEEAEDQGATVGPAAP